MNISINNKYRNYKIHTQMGENMKKIVFTLALVAAMCVCSATATLAGEERERFHFRTVSFPNDTFTQFLGIDDEEMIAGYHGALSNAGFVLSSRTNFSMVTFTTSAHTKVLGVYYQDHIVGSYIDVPQIYPTIQ